LKGLTPIKLSMFNEGLNRALQEAVCDGCGDLTLGSFTDPAKGNLVSQTNSSGLVVRFNGDQCTACHNQPVLGGSGGFMVPNPQDPPTQYRRPENPMFDLMAHRKGAVNQVPLFIRQYGPIREVRFARKPDGRRTEECINYLPSWGGTIFFQGGNRVRARRAICHRQILRRTSGTSASRASGSPAFQRTNSSLTGWESD
jgi:hypothetical protein